MIARLTASIAIATTTLALADGPRQAAEPVRIFVDEPSSSTADEYAITVDDQAVPISSVVRGPQPLSAVVLFDVSASMWVVPTGLNVRATNLPRLDDLRFEGLARAGDSLRLATFADKILLGTISITDRKSAERASKEVTQPAGASPIWDAVYSSASALREAPGLRVVVVFSDGMATGNDRGSSEVRDLVAPSGVVVCVVGFADNALRASSRRMRVIGRNDALQSLARDSGGEYREMLKGDENPVYSIRSLLENLRDRVRLEFMPVRDGAVHRLIVTRNGRRVAAPPRVRF